MATDLMEKVEAIRRRRDERIRMRKDGGPGSGNWGHVGRPGERGGSESGGGSAFRLVSTAKNPKEMFKSQAKIRDKVKSQYKKVKESGNPDRIAKVEKRMAKINMNVKSADKRNIGKAGFKVVNTIDKKASRNILADVKGRGKTAHENSATKVKGTKEAVQYTFPNRTTRGGSGKRGGKTKASRSKY